ncbi:signal peptidase II [Patescibacteria group bacterium]|nr:signal peptidase II [Patescibacteria group bacterium]MBU4347786.1 signal peptidase II [Patescibacteria group bacterium]MBU4455008.1 signal peptidase II [Patescibacteria group bacterium]MCG2690966.1 signal peptidase II [Candidatus Parcubacteria bacterium]
MFLTYSNSRYKIRMTAYILTVILIIFDRFFKFLAVNDFFSKPMEIIGDSFKLNFVGNFNIAFSLPLAGFWLNVIIIFLVLALIYNLLYFIKKRDYQKADYLLFIIFGAISNLLDRLRYGYVIDYFDLKYFTVFNLADVMIVGGVIGLGWLILSVGGQVVKK